MTNLATIDADALSYADPKAVNRRPWPGWWPRRWTRRTYATAIALFVNHLDGEHGHLDRDWSPLVQQRVNGALQPLATDLGKQWASYVYSDAPIDAARKASKCSMR